MSCCTTNWQALFSDNSASTLVQNYISSVFSKLGWHEEKVQLGLFENIWSRLTLCALHSRRPLRLLPP